MTHTPEAAFRAVLPRIERISFNGTASEDVTDFVREVKRIALDQGRQRDQEWMVDYAESCLGGAAIRWFSHLDEISKQQASVSWDALRQQLLDQFEAPKDKLKHTPRRKSGAFTPKLNSGAMTNTLSPTARELSSKVSELASMNAVGPIIGAGARRGRIKVVDSATGGVTYLRHTPVEEVYLGMTSMPSEALLFELSPSVGDKQKMRLRVMWWHLSVCVEDPTSHAVQSEIPGWRNHAVCPDVWTLVWDELLPSWTGEKRASEIRTYDNARLYVFAEGYVAKGYTSATTRAGLATYGWGTLRAI
ncbi:hypothetical protein FRB96_006347 [Tulasnella sp. 330]|nr:hypothetical protein FRB96_006347 [Tulasnella sp. 330]